MIEGRICFNGAVDVVKKALEGAGAAKARLNWEAARKQLLLAIEGAAMMGGAVFGAEGVGSWWRARRCSRWSMAACDAQRELQRARWCCGACAPSKCATSNTFLENFTSHWLDTANVYTHYMYSISSV